MMGYVSLGTNDLALAAKFCDALLGEMGAGRFMETDKFIAWSTGAHSAGLCAITPSDGNPATVGKGVLVAISMDSPEKVDRLYKKSH